MSPIDLNVEDIAEQPVHRVERTAAWWSAAWPFAALCTLMSSRWLIEGISPGTASTGLSEAAGCGVAAGVAGLPFFFRGSGSGVVERFESPWSAGAAGALAVGGAALGASISSRHVSANNATLALCLTPVVVAVALSAWGGSDRDDFTARLWPGLVGIAALLLLLPQPSLSGWRFVMALCVMPLLSGVGAAFTGHGSSLPRQRSPPEGAEKCRLWVPVALLIAAVMFAAMSVAELRAQSEHFSVIAAGLDGLTCLLSLVVLARIGPTRWAAQFLAIPLMTMLEGAVILRPVLDIGSWLAFLLLAIGAGYLLVIGGRSHG